MNADGQQPHILCIDHTPEILHLLQELLQEDGFRVTTRSHVDKDLEEIVRLAPDLITLDYMWSSADEDWAYLQLLKLDRRTAPIPVVLCTGAVREVAGLAEHLQRLHVTVVLKPFPIDVLVHAVQDSLGRPEAVTDAPPTKA
jgi:CheY-like chemotaxis protein